MGVSPNLEGWSILYGRNSIEMQFQLHYFGRIFYNLKVMKNKTTWQYAKFLIGITLTVIIGSFIPLFEAEPDCIASQGQTVVKWKDMYWFPCKYSWNGVCLWPIRRRHVTYKVTVTEGLPIRDDNGKAIPIARGKRRKWSVYDSTDWNALVNFPIQKNKYPDYEPIADNEYVVSVETRYRLFNNVESTLRICTQKP
jgi:hypothetical protein